MDSLIHLVLCFAFQIGMEPKSYKIRNMTGHWQPDKWYFHTDSHSWKQVKEKAVGRGYHESTFLGTLLVAMQWLDQEVQPSPIMQWLYHWFIMCILLAPVQLHNEYNKNGFLTILTFVMWYHFSFFLLLVNCEKVEWEAICCGWEKFRVVQPNHN